MKKFCLIICLLLLTGCHKNISKTCTIKSDSFEQVWNFETKDDVVNTIKLNISYDNTLFNTEGFNELSNTEKLVLKRQILDEVGFLKINDPGLDIDVIIEENIKFVINIDLNKVQKETLEQFGISFQSYNIDEIIKKMEKANAKCE